MPSRMLMAVVAAVMAGCSFDPNGTQAQGLLADGAALADAAGAPDAAPLPDAGPPFCDGQDPTLVACYRFEDPDRPVTDESSYGNDGSDVHDVLLVGGRPGRGQAIAFQPTSVAAVADDTSLDLRTSATVEMWLRVEHLPPAGGRAGLLDNNGQYGLFLAPDGQVRCAMGTTVPSALHVVPGAWTHIACSYDGQAVRLYQDGELKSVTDTMVTLTDGSADGIRLGANSPSGDVLDGALDDVRIFSVARSAAQICAAAGRASCL